MPHTVMGGTGTSTDSSWISVARTRATLLSGTNLDSEWSTDFTENALWGTTIIGGGAPTTNFSTTLDGGVIAASTSTTAGQVLHIHPAGKPALISNSLTKKIYCRFVIRFDGPVDANVALRLGIANPAFLGTGSGKWAFFGISGGASLTNYIVERYNSTLNPVTPTTINIDSSTFHVVEFYSDGTTGTFYYDGVAVSPTCNMATEIGSAPMTIIASIYTANSVVRTIQIDKMYASFLAQ